ncbi:uncharacterized protein LOC129308545 [Prosopis cineraria]|uniref:uncharacterized protein LOC129308545 n=1 Tax=Prosopis cineraria TaxID=364024 RepID=UPI00240EE309|nr:uncharacterized protein LOC129308545 [Prosopis cineraria]
MKGVMQFGKKGKLSLRYIDSFEIDKISEERRARARGPSTPLAAVEVESPKNHPLSSSSAPFLFGVGVCMCVIFNFSSSSVLAVTRAYAAGINSCRLLGGGCHNFRR